MAATNVETFTNPRDSLPNVYTNVTAREIDFVTRFGDNWDALRAILGVMRPIRKAPGSKLVSYTASVDLEDGDVDPGCVIPYSKATIVQAALGDLELKKYAKAVPVEDVNKYGAKIAVQKSDDAFLTKLQNVVLGDFYTFLNTGTLTKTTTTWQDALAKAQGEVLNKFASMDKDVTAIVGFANILDAYDYLGASEINAQNQFGLTYVKDFLGYGTLVLLPAKYIARGTVIATPVENIDLYYIDPGDNEIAELGLNYTTAGETNLIGFHAQGNYGTAVGESFAIMGMALWAEYLDGIAVISIDSDFPTDLTVSSETDSFGPLYDGKVASDLQTGVTVANGEITGTLKFIEGGLDPSGTGPLSGDGYFLALKWSEPISGVTSLKVGLDPSEGTGLVECLDDTDRNGVFKITDKSKQRVVIYQTDGNKKNYQYFGLNGLTLQE